MALTYTIILYIGSMAYLRANSSMVSWETVGRNFTLKVSSSSAPGGQRNVNIWINKHRDTYKLIIIINIAHAGKHSVKTSTTKVNLQKHTYLNRDRNQWFTAVQMTVKKQLLNIERDDGNFYRGCDGMFLYCKKLFVRYIGHFLISYHVRIPHVVSCIACGKESVSFHPLLQKRCSV